MNIREINFINTFKQLKNFKCDLRIGALKTQQFYFSLNYNNILQTSQSCLLSDIILQSCQ